VIMSFAIEGVGALLLSMRFVPEYGFGEGIYRAIFHAVSAYCNAGFDVMGQFRSLTGYAGDFWVSSIIMALYIIGGIGFVVLLEAYEEKRFYRLSLHAKFALLITLFLLGSGTLFILGMEGGNPLTLGALRGGEKVLAAVFTAATPRTAGFNTVPTGQLLVSSQFFILGLMFIGASPASTGGGVKTTTMGILVWTALSVVRGHEDVTLLKRNIPLKTVKKSLAIVLLSLLLVFAVTLVLTVTEDAPFLTVLFEAVSAFGTVGLSLGLTPELSPVGRVLLALTMFAGRIGPLTMVLVFAGRLGRPLLKYPDENIMIG
jgi:trk system potassium uptake protein